MDGAGALSFRIAREAWEFEQVHRLNYKTFVEEIPQHHANGQRVLVDRFHDQNTYAICVRQRQVVGMLALRFDRPFSLDQKLPDLDRYLPAGVKGIAEIRLLATEKEHRGSRVAYGLFATAARHCIEKGIDLVVISGTTRQLRLYRHMGFVPFGPLVGTPGAMFQPMYLTRDRFMQTARLLQMNIAEEEHESAALSFLPGPVDITPQVRHAFASAPVSHRSDQFLADFHHTQALLRNLVNSRNVQILTGSGTLANDVVAAQLSLLRSRGLVLSNGEFGDRLINHARRMKLDFATHRVPWGGVIDLGDVERTLDADPSIQWIWAVHCETSTGVLNDLEGLKRLCAARGLKLCLDCISSIGTVAVDLSGVFLASGISGKGLRGFPGLCMVFHDHPIEHAPMSLPRYLDLSFYAEKSGVPFTLCSNLLYAMKTALEQIRPADRFQAIAEHSRHIRRELEEMGLNIVGPENSAAPAVISIALLPAEVSALRVGDKLADAGYLLSYRSDYLLERNWVQICLMGEYTHGAIDQMLALLRKLAVRPRSRAQRDVAALEV